MSPDEVQAIVEAGFESRAAVENEHLKRQIVQAKEQLSKLASVQAELEEMREQNIRLDAQLETSKEERQRLENKISDLTNRIEQLAREAGREYAKGFVDGMKEEGGRKGDSE